MRKYLFFLYVIFHTNLLFAQAQNGSLAPKPVYRDPIFDGAADPVLIWNKKSAKWLMFYTNRRATDTVNGGVSWVHGTRIGVAESKDGANWKYLDTANIRYRPDSGYTFWAPEVIENKGIYHMYLTYVPGTFKNWNHPRNIIHLTSKDLFTWNYESTLPLINDRVIDPCIIRMPSGAWRMWYNNEKDHKSTYYADSKDLYHWSDGKKAIFDQPGEGPKVFRWKNKYWMITDVWQGLAVYSSDDLDNWTRQPGENLLAVPGTGTDDAIKGGHCDVVVSASGRAYLYYFVHPGNAKGQSTKLIYNRQRTSIQVVELQFQNGKITCYRDLPTYVALK